MFSWHYDALPPGHDGGQRAATCLVYLNDVAEGGRTAFRDLRAGGTDADGKPPFRLEFSSLGSAATLPPGA